VENPSRASTAENASGRIRLPYPVSVVQGRADLTEQVPGKYLEGDTYYLPRVSSLNTQAADDYHAVPVVC
jgi:hypothetical protein